MKNIFLKNAIIAASFLVLTGHTSIASAADVEPMHTATGLTLGVAETATDIYKITCYSDPLEQSPGPADRLVARVRDAAPVAAPRIRVQAVKTPSGPAAAPKIDTVDGNGSDGPPVWSGYSAGSIAQSAVGKGNGTYFIIVSKSAAGAETYSLDYHCQTNAGLHTGTLPEDVDLTNPKYHILNQ